MKPNILWLILSQWRADLVGPRGHPQVATPTFDRLAQEGVWCVDAFANHPFSTQSKACILSGLLAQRSSVLDVYDPLPAHVATAAAHLGASGYATAHLGKWQLGHRDRSTPVVGEEAARKVVPVGERGGFDYWWGWDGGFLIQDPWVHGNDQAVPVRLPGHQAPIVARKASQLVQTLRCPWFLCVHLDPPHPPYFESADGCPARDPATIALPADVPPGGALERQVRRELAGALAQLEAADRACGRIIAELEQARLLENTLVVMTSTHGDQHGSGGYLRKGWPHSGSVRVPLVLRHSRLLPRGVELPGFFGLVDLLPTTLGLVGVRPISKLDGIDWSEALRSRLPVARSGYAALPIAPGMPNQCPFPWAATVSRNGIEWRDSTTSACGVNPWDLPGWR